MELAYIAFIALVGFGATMLTRRGRDKFDENIKALVHGLALALVYLLVGGFVLCAIQFVSELCGWPIRFFPEGSFNGDE